MNLHSWLSLLQYVQQYTKLCRGNNFYMDIIFYSQLFSIIIFILKVLLSFSENVKHLLLTNFSYHLSLIAIGKSWNLGKHIYILNAWIIIFIVQLF